MANAEHLVKLYEGVKIWNTWRGQNSNIRPDLQEADLFKVNFGRVKVNLCRVNLCRANLEGADLEGADFGEANLEEADLEGANLGKVDFRGANLRRAFLDKADLHEANLSGTNLSEADLRGADLRRAILFEADLRGADLHRVNLRGVELVEANLGGANLDRADLTRTELWETIFANVDLTAVKGLESCVHKGPSTIDHRTLTRSDNLPLSFLRGCGLPDTFIDYLPSLLNQPIQFYSCFISYSSKDEAFAQRLHADLQDKGVRCWFAPEDMKIGDRIRTRIDEVIRIHDKLLLILSQNSVTSAWVEKEVETAFDKEIERKEPVLFPIRLDTAVMESRTGWAADIRRSRHIGNFCNWKNHDDYQRGLERLFRDLQVKKDKS